VNSDLWALVPIAGMATGALFMLGVYKLMSRFLDLKARREAVGPTEELRELQRDVDELRALPQRVAELEERLDFAERLLARGAERGVIQPGS